MEFRQLEAFVAVATELHFGHAAQKLHIGQPSLSDLVRRLEREVGTQLLARSTRRVALTSAGSDLLERANVILEEAADAIAAMQKWSDGEAGIVRLAVAPPVAPNLACHLKTALSAVAPNVDLIIRRLWPRDLERAVGERAVDVAITCGPVPAHLGVSSTAMCGEPLLVGLRPDHRLVDRSAVALSDLADETLGMHSEALFPSWVWAQRGALLNAGLSPRIVELSDTDLSACRWPAQAGVDWILTTASSAMPGPEVAIRPIAPQQLVPFLLHWVRDRAQNPAVSRFVRLALHAGLPMGLVKFDANLRRSRALVSAGDSR